MIIKVESYKIFSEIYCPIMPAPLELFFGDGCRSVYICICNNVCYHETLINYSILSCYITIYHTDSRQEIAKVGRIFPILYVVFLLDHSS